MGSGSFDLAPITDPSLVASEAAQVLGVREEPDGLLRKRCAPREGPQAAVDPRQLRAFDQRSANLANALLRAAPDIRSLQRATSGLARSRRTDVSRAPLPVPERTAGVEELARSTAVQLFIERTKLHKPGFRSHRKGRVRNRRARFKARWHSARAGLAAARMRALSVAEINKRLHDRFKLLTRGGRVLLPRQQTLRALVDWSYDLLQENEQLLLGSYASSSEGSTSPRVEGGLRRRATPAPPPETFSMS